MPKVISITFQSIVLLLLPRTSAIASTVSSTAAALSLSFALASSLIRAQCILFRMRFERNKTVSSCTPTIRPIRLDGAAAAVAHTFSVPRISNWIFCAACLIDGNDEQGIRGSECARAHRADRDENIWTAAFNVSIIKTMRNDSVEETRLSRVYWSRLANATRETTRSLKI